MTARYMEQSTHVLIFDDDADILELCTIILTKSGCTVTTRDSCKNLLETIDVAKPDVIFMDNWIPDTGGIEATRMIKSNNAYRHIPVIYFSANNDIQTLAAKAGADTYLAKPFNVSDLVDAVMAATSKCSGQL